MIHRSQEPDRFRPIRAGAVPVGHHGPTAPERRFEVRVRSRRASPVRPARHLHRLGGNVPAVPPNGETKPTIVTADEFCCWLLDEGFEDDIVNVINSMISANRRPPQTWDAMIQRRNGRSAAIGGAARRGGETGHLTTGTDLTIDRLGRSACA